MTRELVVSLPRLHPGQIRRRERIAKAEARFVVTMCGRRWGKTIDGEEWIEDGALNGEPCAWFAPTYKYLADVWRSLAYRLRPAARKINETEKRIELLTGGVIECWTLDTSDAGRSRKYKRAVIDEAGIVRGLMPMWQQAIRPTLVDLRGSAWIYGTPKGRTHDFTQLFAKGESEEPGWLSHRAPTRENPYIPPEEIEAARRDMPASAFQQEFEGVPADDGGNPFGLDSIQKCIADLSPELPAVWGWDFARAQDWTVGVAIDPYGRVCRVERWQGKPWGETKRLVADATRKVPAVGDSTGIGDVIVESLQAMNTPIAGYMFTSKSKQTLMERLAVAIQSRQITFPAGAISSELETFAYEYTAHGVRYSAPDGLHDDAVMALALAVYAYDRVAPRVAAQEIPVEHDKRDPNRWQDYVGVSADGSVSGDGFDSQLPRGW